ncbi:hypothetical protein RFI_04082 [Reticulomyxa filosa]|uniref:Uncharacterized protein n=1 Tax=Reticulomyxa filosa TaxID=46433 RepID=X6P3A9_RETFI|nr:hypothetical protein RFI_04082 [Reticulomyxa filosa]|eukprot:ETO33025.1 hypothetical protein RFI_04082 [Reticulomyxa filosa]
MSFKACLNDGIKVHTLLLTELTIKNLKQQVTQASRSTQVDSVLVTITDGNGCYVETDKSVADVFAKEPVYFIAHFQPKETQKKDNIVKEKEYEKETPASYKIKNPLVLLAGAMKQQHWYFKSVQKDLDLLQTLFQSKFGYQVFNAYRLPNVFKESFSLDGLNTFLLEHCLDVADFEKDGSNSYDGLIFVWYRGHEEYESEDESLHINNIDPKDIQDIFAEQTAYFVGKPKIFINIAYVEQEQYNYIATNLETQNNSNNNVWRHHQDKDIFTIFVMSTTNSSESDSDSDNDIKESCFTKMFCQIVEKNITKRLNVILNHAIGTTLEQTLNREIAQTGSMAQSEIYLISSSPVHSRNQDNHGDAEIKCAEMAEMKEEEKERDNSVTETLDFKKYWNRKWRRCNAEATKIVRQMLDQHEQGLVMVVYGSFRWKNLKDKFAAFIALVNNDNVEQKQFEEYWLYVIKRKVIVLDAVNIDGNVYAVDCEIQCKGSVNIAIQLFVTKNAMIDPVLKRSIAPIQWNTQMHHDIPVQLQAFEDDEEKCSEKKQFDIAIIHLQKHLQIAIDQFGLHHPYVAISYNMIGNAHYYNKQYDKSIEFYEKSLKSILSIFGTNYSIVAQLYHNLGNTYNDKFQYEKANECHEKALKIRLNIFGETHVDVAWSYISVGNAFFNKSQYSQAIEFYEKSLKIRLDIFGIDNVDVAWSYLNIGNSYFNKGHYSQAIESYDMLLKIRLLIFGVDNIDVAWANNNLANAYQNDGQLVKAIEYHQKALEIRRRILGKVHKSVGDSCWRLALAFQQREDKATARKYFEEAWKVNSVLLGEWHEQTWEAKRNVELNNTSS